MTDALDRAAPFLVGALAEGGDLYNLDDLREMLASGGCRLFLGESSALFAIAEQHPRETVLCLWLAGGDLDELVTTLRPAAEAWGQSEGCRRAALVGRRGWVKPLSAHGYRAAQAVFLKDL